MNRKYFFFDIDGTLINGGFGAGAIPESAKEALRLLRENGHFVAIATGRSHAMAEDIRIALGFENMVSDGGNGITIDGVLKGIEPLDKKLCCTLIDECIEKKIPWAVSIDNTKVRYSPDNSFPWAVRKNNYMDTAVIPGLDPRSCDNIYKVYIAGDKSVETTLQALKPLPWCRYNPYYFFVEPCDKAVGIRKMMEYLGGNISDVVVFGDQKNDLTMFSPEWTSIAMGNAIDELKAKADYITSEVGNDGIYNACKHFGWI